MSSNPRQLGPLAGKVAMPALIAGLVGISAAVLLTVTSDTVDTDRFFRGYLFAFMCVLAPCLGALIFTMIQHMTRAGWSVTVRRIAECIAGNLMWIWILFVPIMVAVHMHWTHMYHWADADTVHGDALLEHKEPYLNLGFWTIRAVVFFGIWAVLAMFFFKNSVAQDATGDVNRTHAMQKLAPLGIAMYALTQTFACIDWVMSLEAHWFSTMFGVYFFAVSCCGFYACLAITMRLLQNAGRVRNEITKEHFQDVGKLLFAFGVVFWAYIGFSQFMLIWYANIPEETTWFIVRTSGGWLPIAWLLIVCHFAIPFVLLVTKHTKRASGVLALIAAWLLIWFVVDIYWLVMPTVPAEALAGTASLEAIQEGIDSGAIATGFAPHVIDVLLLIGMAGLTIGMTVRRMGSCALVPEQDPRLGEALAFENV